MGDIKTHVITIKALQQRGLRITAGQDYVPKSWLPPRDVSLAEVHKRLAKIHGSLADDIAQARDQG